MYAKNLSAFLAQLIKDDSLNLDFDDEIIGGTCITHEGRVVHEGARQAMEGGSV